MHLLAHLGLLKTEVTDFPPTHSYISICEILALQYTCMKPEKGTTPFGRNLPVWTIIGSTPVGSCRLSVSHVVGLFWRRNANDFVNARSQSVIFLYLLSYQLAA